MLWQVAIDWVHTSGILIRKTLGKKHPHFPGTPRDLEALAIQLAFEVLQACGHSGRYDTFTARFCWRLRNELIALCAGPSIDPTQDIQTITDQNVVPDSPGTPWVLFRRRQVFEQCLPYMTRRQAKVWRQYLGGGSLEADGVATREDRGVAILNCGIERFLRKTGGLA